MDEPTAGLSPLYSQMVVDKLEEIRTAGTVILLVEQDIDLALRSADRVMVLETGKTVFDGLPGDLMGNETLMRLYPGG
ncbi:hypothetical protein [Aestuariibius sp. HNIBRBA575]|uniref:hypothetical protein n=1 Tax=Aestuariibius sp. HNIBRBA575 TaxID=3233343 RepID=UPI0034A4ADEC